MSTAEPGALGTQDASTVALRVIDPAAPAARSALPAENTAAAPARRPGRDRYLDLLRALALVRVVVYHNFSWNWLPIVFPSMGVMFALAGSLMARSLERPALSVIRGRLRRLLPPMWLFGAVVVPLMLLAGWRPDVHHPTWWWADLAYWVLPLSEPPFGATLHTFGGHLPSSWAEQICVPLWYLRAYLWYVLLSPLMLKAMRKLPWVTLLVPVALAFLVNSGLVDQSGRLMEAVTDFTTFGACWLLGMAHQEGLLRRIPQYVVPSLAPLMLVFGYWWLLRSPVDNPRLGHDLEAVPVAQAIWSLGAVLLLLHLSPSWETWPRPLERFNGVISLLNSRAVTVYLWHSFALVLTEPLIDPLWSNGFFYDHLQWLLASQWTPLVIAVPLICLAILLFGWIEDVAARRRPRLFPYPRRPKGRRRG
ncbi:MULTISPECIES: acyltransferase [unclassified Streptomyces]|uniref:acyltransferase family protein n=1 Tax=unclassified Streptomyces TaxID=2593676 RepID=UPI0038158FA1